MSTTGQILSREEVSALVEAVQSGNVDTSSTITPLSAVTSYSLFENDTTSRGQLTALEMINDRFSRQLRGSLLTLLRQAARVTVAPFDVMTFGAYLKTLPSPTNVNIVRFPPLRGYGLVTIEPPIVYGAVDSFFGGPGGATLELSPTRGFTQTEERIIQLLLDVMFDNLRDAWAPIYALSPEFVSREINPAFAQIGEDRETVIVCRYDLELGPDVRGQLSVMYPFSALKPIRLLLRGGLQAAERDEKLALKWSEQLGDAVSDSELEMVAQLATFEVPALDLAAIRPGDTLWFKPLPSVKVVIQSSHIFDAEYGTSDGNVAIRIERVMERPGENKKSADDSTSDIAEADIAEADIAEADIAEEPTVSRRRTPAQRKRA
ncbi:MAG: flagellar motor switch protein FliM [Gammaproteobacteria bacterium]|nr:flagellar motor switch protein FliM [Gammaproteobacteria bacterium]